MAEMPKTAEVKVDFDVVGLPLPSQIRVLALKEARSILVSRNPMGAQGTVDSMDVYLLAEYIITGNDPWADVRKQAPTIPTRKRRW